MDKRVLSVMLGFMVGLLGCSETKPLPGVTAPDASVSDADTSSMDAALDARPFDAGSDATLEPLWDLSRPDFAVDDAGMRIDCIGDLSEVGLDDFTLAFKIRTTATVLSQVISQREACSYGRFWNIRMQADGSITFEIGDGAGAYINVGTTATVNDGIDHLVEIVRVDGKIRVDVDDARSPLRYYTATAYPDYTGPLDSVAPDHEVDAAVRLGPTLPTLDWMNSLVCTSDGTQPLEGTVTPYCITPGEILL